MAFRFKQFFVADDRCAMKVGTDGVLLGAWSRVESLLGEPCRILDIGTGSGLVALMLAQQYTGADILGIDISPEAVGQANANFAASPWGNRLSAVAVPLQSCNAAGPFDIVVSNPPYFNNSLRAPERLRSAARHTDTLSYEELFLYSERLLASHGHLFLVLPADAESVVMQIVSRYPALVLQQICYVHGTPAKPAKRILLHFAKAAIPGAVESSHLVLESQPNHRTPEYARLTEDFYL